MTRLLVASRCFLLFSSLIWGFSPGAWSRERKPSVKREVGFLASAGLDETCSTGALALGEAALAAGYGFNEMRFGNQTG